MSDRTKVFLFVILVVIFIVAVSVIGSNLPVPDNFVIP